MLKQDRAIFGLEPEYYDEQVVQKAIKNTVKSFGLKVKQLLLDRGYTTLKKEYKHDTIAFVVELKDKGIGIAKIPITYTHFTTNLQGDKVVYPIQIYLSLNSDRKLKVLDEFKEKLVNELNRLEKELEEYAYMVTSYNENLEPIPNFKEILGHTPTKSKTPVTDAILLKMVETGEAKHLGDIYFD